eukprot:360200-Chlamydomonas_euryale.AAC.1
MKGNPPEGLMSDYEHGGEALPWAHDSGGPAAEPAQAPDGGGKGFQRPTACTGAWRRRERLSKTYCLHSGAQAACACPSASLHSAGDQRPHGPAAAAPCQRPQCLLAPDHQHGQQARWHPPPDSSDVRWGTPAHAHPYRGEAHTPPTCHMASMPDGSTTQLLFVEGLVGLGGVVRRPCSTWRHGAVATQQSPLPMSRWRGGGGMGWLKTARSDVPIVTAPRPLSGGLLRDSEHDGRRVCVGRSGINVECERSMEDDLTLFFGPIWERLSERVGIGVRLRKRELCELNKLERLKLQAVIVGALAFHLPLFVTTAVREPEERVP